MMNKKFEYTLEDGIYYPNIEIGEGKSVALNKYGRMRLNILNNTKEKWLV